MSLDYYYGKIENSDTVVFDENDKMRPEVQSVIFLTMPTGMPILTKENVPEFYRRFRLLYRVKGYTDQDAENTGVNLELLYQLVGLGTNASRKTYAAFKKDLMTELDDQADRMVSTAVLRHEEKVMPMR